MSPSKQGTWRLWRAAPPAFAETDAETYGEGGGGGGGSEEKVDEEDEEDEEEEEEGGVETIESCTNKSTPGPTD